MDNLSNPNLSCPRINIGGIANLYVSSRANFGAIWFFEETTAPYQYGRIVGHNGTQNVWFNTLLINNKTAQLTSVLRDNPSRTYDVDLQFTIQKWDLEARDVSEQLFAIDDAIFIAEDFNGQFWLVGETGGCKVTYTSQSGAKNGNSEITLTATTRQRNPLRQVSDAYVSAYVTTPALCACDIEIATLCGESFETICGYSLACAAPLGPYTPPTPDPSLWGGFNNCLSFDGINDYVDVLDNAALNFGTGDFSISLWVYHDNNTGNQTYLTHRTLAPRKGYSLFHSPSPGLGVRFEVSDGVQYIIDSAVILSNATWYHVVAVVEGTDRTNWKIYIDGVDVKSGTGTDAGISKDVARNLNMGDDTLLATRLNGRLDETTMYDRALTPAEVTYLFNGGLGNSPDAAMETNLVARWAFDTLQTLAGNNTAVDFGPNGLTGTLTNFGTRTMLGSVSPAWVPHV